MNNTIYFDSPVDDYIRRQELYQGQLFVYSPSPSSIALSAFAREMIQEAFGSTRSRPNTACLSRNM